MIRRRPIHQGQLWTVGDLLLGDIPLRWKLAAAARWIEAWWRITTALPGDRFWMAQRDVYVEVHSGRPGHLRGYVLSGQLAAKHVELDKAFLHCGPPQPLELHVGRAIAFRSTLRPFR